MSQVQPSVGRAPVAAQRRQQGGAAAQEGGGIGQTIAGVVRMAVFWYFAMKFFAPKRPASNEPAVLLSNTFDKGEPMDMWLYLTEKDKFNDFSNEDALYWHETNIPYGVWGPTSTRKRTLTYYPSEALKHNGSLYAHVFFARSGYPADPSDPEYDPKSAFGGTHPVVVHLRKSKVDKKKSLLDETSQMEDDSEIETKEEGPVEYISYWKPNITINLLDDFNRYQHNNIPQTVVGYLNVDFESARYYPIIYFNDFWLLKDKLIAVNETVGELPLNLEVGPISVTKWQWFLQIEQAFQMHRSYGSMLEGEADELKRVFLEGNPYLLAVTMAVSLLHSLFDFLAFKNDIQFWNKNKSMEGLSAKSVVLNFVCQVIIFLYLLDNETSWMILFSSGIGLCIEFWKIGKAMHVEIDRSGRIPLLKFRDRESYANNKTKEYDDIAMKYLSYVLFFLAACFAVYSLKYDKHKSWYSWILSSLTSCVYMFVGMAEDEKTKVYWEGDGFPRVGAYTALGRHECRTERTKKKWHLESIRKIKEKQGIVNPCIRFIMMCPQLFINYKLKSVAHMPWRQMTYKFLNTIIDDLFAFVIKMPLLHRLSVFRDDVIFLIYLYQRWVYPVDKKRVNEFGFGGAEEETQQSQITEGAESSSTQEGDKKTN